MNKQAKVILHIDNGLPDRESIVKLFAKGESLCCDVRHHSSIDQDPASANTSIADYVTELKQNKHLFDFLILDLALTLQEEDKLKEWYAAEQLDELTSLGLRELATGVKLLDCIIKEDAFPHERIAVYTQFNPHSSFDRNLTMLGGLWWNGIKVKVFYKGEQGEDRRLKQHVEEKCGARTHSIYFCCSDKALGDQIQGTICGLDGLAPNHLILPFRVPSLALADQRYADEYKRHRFSAAVIQLVQNDSDRERMEEVNNGDEKALERLSTIPLIRSIEQVSNPKTQIVCLTEGEYTPATVRALMDPTIGVDWLINANLFNINIFSTLWKILATTLR